MLQPLCESQQTRKFWKRWEYQTTLPASWETWMQGKKQQLEPDMEQQTGSKLGKEYVRLYIVTVLQFSSIQSLGHVLFFATPWTAARQASLSITNSQRLLKLMSIESVMPSNHLILCRPLFLPPSIFHSIRVWNTRLDKAQGETKISGTKTEIQTNETR